MDRERPKSPAKEQPPDSPPVTRDHLPLESDRTSPQGSAAFSTFDAELAGVIGSARWAGTIRFLRLSPRERQIIECILTGVEGDALIGDCLGMPSRTVHTHLERLFRKLHVTSRSQLLVRLFVAYATRADAGGGDKEPP